MDANKPTYEELEKELEEYQTLLWQLSDEYKLNLGNAEKKISELESKCKNLEKEQHKDSENTTNTEKNSEIEDSLIEEKSASLSSLGLPACVIDKTGEILEFNNKFKFLVELLSFDVETISNISKIFDKDSSNEIAENYKLFQSTEEGLFQNILSVKNAFNVNINILVRIYACKENSNFLAMFIELNSMDIHNLQVSTSQTTEKKESEEKEQVEAIKKDNTIEIFAEKYEVYQKLLKIFGKKRRKKPELLPEEVYLAFIRAFNLEHDRNNILFTLNEEYEAFAKDIKRKYPQITNNEEKHCMLIKAGLTYKEIAAIMDISVNGVKIARNRLRKKLNIDSETTSDFINEL